MGNALVPCALERDPRHSRIMCILCLLFGCSFGGGLCWLSLVEGSGGRGVSRKEEKIKKAGPPTSFSRPIIVRPVFIYRVLSAIGIYSHKGKEEKKKERPPEKGKQKKGKGANTRAPV